MEFICLGLLVMLSFPARAAVLGEHNALSPAGPQAANIAELWYLTIIICILVFAAVLAVFIYALWKSRASKQQLQTDLEPDLIPDNHHEKILQRSVVWAVAISTILLIVLIAASIYTDRMLASLPLTNGLHIKVTAHQWWWEVRYDDKDTSNTFTTANEIHIPINRPVVLTLKASDVIHSFWVPNLSGKADLIPGRTSTLRLRADKAGKYRGQCAEFCGNQHALMAFEVTAEAEPDFAR